MKKMQLTLLCLCFILMSAVTVFYMGNKAENSYERLFKLNQEALAWSWGAEAGTPLDSDADGIEENPNSGYSIQGSCSGPAMRCMFYCNGTSRSGLPCQAAYVANSSGFPYNIYGFCVCGTTFWGWN